MWDILSALIAKHNLMPVTFQQCMWCGHRDKWYTFYTNLRSLKSLAVAANMTIALGVYDLRKDVFGSPQRPQRITHPSCACSLQNFSGNLRAA